MGCYTRSRVLDWLSDGKEQTMNHEPVKDHAERKRISALIEQCEKEQTMSDNTIKRADVEKALNEWVGSSTANIFQLIDKIPSAERPQSEWILCSERMPEEREWIGTKKFGTTISDKVLVTFESRGERFVRQIHFQNGELGGADKHTMDTVHGEWKAVAWMPLPEPWKGADNEID